MLASLRAHPLLRRLWLASTISLVGDWLSFVAMSLLALDQGGGPLALAVVLAVHHLPHALLSPVAGALADRFDRRRLLIHASLGQAVLTALMALAAYHRALALMQALVLVRAALGAFVVPASTAALRRVVPEGELVAANALLSFTWSLTFVGGMALGGAIATLGPVLAMVLDALSFLVAALVLAGLPAMRPLRDGIARPPRLFAAIAGTPRDLVAALRIALAEPLLLRAVLAKTPLAIAGGAGWLVLNLSANRYAPFGSAALSLGLLQAVRGAGTGLGPIASEALVRRGREALAFHLAAALFFLALLAFPFATSAPLLVLLALVWGMGTGSNWVLSAAALQRLAPDAALGRLASLDDLSMTVAFVAGALLGALAIERGHGAVAASWVGVALGVAMWIALMRPRAAAEEPVISAA